MTYTRDGLSSCDVTCWQLGGATLLEDGNAAEDVLDVSNGMRLDRSGWDSPYFVTDTDRLVGTNHSLQRPHRTAPP
eukprot:37413-Eustigmatos_ZCMA.PRE.1